MVALADLPDFVYVSNLVAQPLVLAGGYARLNALDIAAPEADQNRRIQLDGLSDSMKSQVWLALFTAQEAGLLKHTEVVDDQEPEEDWTWQDAADFTALTDPVDSEHQLVGGQDALGAVTPE